MRFDTKEGAFVALDDEGERFAIMPGDLSKSQLVQRITHQDLTEKMPPLESNLSLSAYEIELLKRWIEQGAEWKSHWAFIPPEKSSLPKVKDPSWPRNEIDHFVAGKMNQEGLKPSKEAEKTELIRPLAFDLTGLPPTLEEVDAFLDDNSPNSYEKMIDHYLSSPAYGERMAVPWLDLARYADTHGYQDDLDRTMWPWRDWVIKAFKGNMPFDQFTLWQLAGDLLPEPTYEQKLATAFNRNHAITQEMGSIDEEYRVEYVADRTQTIGTTFLGLTLQCARCHDHKYDPISQKEFYQLFAFSNSVPEKGVALYHITPEPNLPLPEKDVEEIIAYIREGVEKAKEWLEEVKDLKGDLSGSDNSKVWKESKLAVGSSQRHGGSTSSSPLDLTNGLVDYFNFDHFENGKVLNVVNPGKSGKAGNDVIEAQGKFGGAVAFYGDSYKDKWQNHLDLGNVGNIDVNQPYTISYWLNMAWVDHQTAIIYKKDEKSNRGYWVTLNFAWPTLRTFGPNGFGMMAVTPLPENRWFHMAWTYDGSRNTAGLNLYVDGAPQVLRIWAPGKLDDGHAKLPYQAIRNNKSMLLGREGLSDKHYLRAPLKMDELRFYDRSLTQDEIRHLVESYSPTAVLQEKENRTAEEEKSLRQHYLHFYDAEYQEAIKNLGHQKIIEQQVRKQLQPTLVMADTDTLRPAYVLNRGVYQARGEKVYPGTPNAILPFDDKLPKNRLGLAQWLTDPQNPLTARVTVNRFWQLIFGEGLVSTVDDFGNQGALPTHPELLDWLAVEFVESGWDVKHILRLMVNSATYRQSSRIDGEGITKDPQNIFLARGPQYRLPAEMIRDNVLAMSGLLIPKIGGPSVRPYQPAGLWEELSCGRGTKYYFQDFGESLYRRSLYTFWKRTVPPPSMITFDAATRNYCLPKRQKTSTPFQALVLLNDPQVLEAARVFGIRMMQEGGVEMESRIKYGFRAATSRLPTRQELALLEEVWRSEKAIYKEDHEAAKELLSIGEWQTEDENDLAEWAAYAQVASAIFNMDEVVTKY